MASALSIRQSNVSYWAKVGNIPNKWHPQIIKAAGGLGIHISASDFIDPGEDDDVEVIQPSKKGLNLTVIKNGSLNVAGQTVRCAVLSNGVRVVFQRELVALLTGHKKGGLSRYMASKNLEPFVPAKFKNRPLDEAVYTFPVMTELGEVFAQGFDGTDLIEICDMYLKARAADKLLDAQQHLAAQAEIIVRAFAKVGIIAAIDEATGYQKQKDEYQKLLAKYIAEELQPWVLTFGENYYMQIYRLKGWDWGRHITEKKNHPWEVARITNRIIYEKLPSGVLDKLNELNPKNASGNRKHKKFQFLTMNTGYVHLVKHMGHVESIMERHAPGEWHKALHEIDTRFPSLRDPYGNSFLGF